MKIPEKDQQDVIDLFWQMLMELEGRTKPDENILNKMLVEDGFKVMQRIGVTTHKPRWKNE